ncbi:MAG TPA: RNA polymerase sigma factor [Chloroflexia bacterium]|nr:RNA polymerase sigma factor [Chloroflexia bacterium]
MLQTLTAPTAIPFAAAMRDDHALVAALHRGETHAMEQLVQQYGPVLHRYAYYQVQDATVAEDLVAEVFVRVMEKIHRYVQGSTPLQAWLFRIIRNLIADHYRARKRRPQVSLEQWLTADPGAEPGSFDCGIDSLPVRDELQAGLRALTAEQREVIILHVIEGWELPQAARMLGRSLPSVKSLYYRGMESLRRELGASSAPQPIAAGVVRARGQVRPSYTGVAEPLPIAC